nr:RNA-directed DNA polymerase, eukaryota [Tanacetum cinerariifolium]
ILEERLKKTQAEVNEGSSKRARDEIEQESAKRQRVPRGGLEETQVEELSKLVQPVDLNLLQDKWTWSLNRSSEYTIASSRYLIDVRLLPKGELKTRWIRFVSIKVNILAWKVMTNSLPTRFNILRRGIDIESVSCVNCDFGVETSNHLLFACDMAKKVSKLIARWWEVPFIDLDSYGDWRTWIDNVKMPKKNKIMFEGKASILVNGSPTPEFQFHRGLKQGDPLAPFLFLLIMESLHLSFSRSVEAGIFTGFRVDHSITLSRLFYADDAVFIGMSINIQKSHLLGVGIPDNCVAEAVKSIGCSIMKAHFKYLGILVGYDLLALVDGFTPVEDNIATNLSLELLMLGQDFRIFLVPLLPKESELVPEFA